jgi:Metallo-peptidase family M12
LFLVFTLRALFRTAFITFYQSKPHMRYLALKLFMLLSVCVLTACQQMSPFVSDSAVAADEQTSNERQVSGLTKPGAKSMAAVAKPAAAAQNANEDFVLAPKRLKVAQALKGTAGYVAGLSEANIIVNVAVEVDYELYQQFNYSEQAVRTYVADLFSAVSAVYRRDANITIKPSFVRVWTTPADPWTKFTTLDALYELQAYYNTYGTTIQRSAVALLSGKQQMSGGIAYVDGVCASQGAYDTLVVGTLDGVINNTPGPNTWDVVALAHELGHILGSNHSHCTARADGGGSYDKCWGTETSSSACYAGPNIFTNGTIMSYCNQGPTGMNAVNPLSFVNDAQDFTIKNIIRTNTEQWTIANRPAGTPGGNGCLAIETPTVPGYLPGILHLLSE